MSDEMSDEHKYSNNLPPLTRCRFPISSMNGNAE